MSDKSNLVAKSVTPAEVKVTAPAITGEYKPGRGDKFTLSITGVLTGTLACNATVSPREDNPALYMNEEATRIVHASKVTASMLKKFARISSIRVYRESLTLASARADKAGYALTCFEASEAFERKSYTYKAGSKWSTPSANEAYATQQNASRVIVALRALIAKHFNLTVGTSESGKSLAEQKALNASLQEQLEAALKAQSELLARLTALEAGAAVNETAHVKIAKK